MTRDHLAQRLQVLRDRYYLLVGPLLLLLGIGLGNSPMLGWTAGILLALLSANQLVPLFRDMFGD